MESNEKEKRPEDFKIEPIPKLLNVYGFIFMVLIFSLVLLYTYNITIPMQFAGTVKKWEPASFEIFIDDSKKLEFTPESKDSIEIYDASYIEKTGKFMINSVISMDSSLILQFKDENHNLSENDNVILVSKNISLFNLVFDRFFN